MKHVTASLNESESLGNHSEYLKDTTDKFIGEDDDEEGEEGKKNWADSEVETLIALRGEMDSEFVKNWKKQGTCLQLFNACSTISFLKAFLLSLHPHSLKEYVLDNWLRAGRPGTVGRYKLLI